MEPSYSPTRPAPPRRLGAWLAWGSQQRLTQVSTPELTATYQYDLLGRRVQRQITKPGFPPETTHYVYDGLQAVGEIRPQHSSTSLMTGLNLDEMLARVTTLNATNTTQARTYLTDALGSIIAQTQDNQSTLAGYSYSPYGQTQSTGNTEGDSVQYTARENDHNGLYYYRARYYDPVLKRFLSEDPIGLAGGSLSFYSYVEGNPVSFSDPTGLLRYNRPSPHTVPPTGETLNSLRCLEACLQRNSNNPCLDLLVTGGSEKTGHSKNSHHYKGQAVDIAGSNPVSHKDVMECAARCGFGAGHYEHFPKTPNRNHWHFQKDPGNGVPALPAPSWD